jgi:hypothetical protein
VCDLAEAVAPVRRQEDRVRFARQHAQVAALKRHRQGDDPEVLKATGKLRADVLAAQIRAALDAAVLTDEQRSELARQLAPELAG